MNGVARIKIAAMSKLIYPVPPHVIGKAMYSTKAPALTPIPRVLAHRSAGRPYSCGSGRDRWPSPLTVSRVKVGDVRATSTISPGYNGTVEPLWVSPVIPPAWTSVPQMPVR
jgi:hypothetical protein